MSDSDIRDAMVGLLNTAGIPVANISFENKPFDPDDRSDSSYYIAFYFMPSTEDSAGKTLNDDSEQLGSIQISVFTNLNSDYYGTKYLETIDTIKGAFLTGVETSYNGQAVTILDSSNISPSDSESWYQGGLTINYRAFKKRV
jgi:hypothetical protein